MTEIISKKKALISLTSYNEAFYGDGKKTGVFLVEALHPFVVFQRYGYEVDFVSENGSFGVDDYALSQEYLIPEDLNTLKDRNSPFRKHLLHVKKPIEVSASEYEIFLASSGHGCLFDYPHSKVQKLAVDIYNNGGIIAAISHGISIFDGFIDVSTGENVIKNRSVTGFSDIGEKLLQVDEILKKKKLATIPEISVRLGAKYLSPCGPFDDFSLTDGRIVTGASPAASVSTALRATTAIKEIRIRQREKNNT
ncbi:glutathione-independent glyoxalase Hsp31p [[Candida] anglica]|uniref:D-lactate dehydratase n=1 Tax=[Candida] anglica TaxID=148631 RepID=A0ABP0EBT3_9ASCO